MNIVAHLTECKPRSTIASARVARFIVNNLDDSGSACQDMRYVPDQFMLVDTKHKASELLQAYMAIDTLFIVNGPMAFCDFLPELADLVRKAARVVFVQQDYTIMPPSAHSKAESAFRKVFADLNLRPIFWTTVMKNVLMLDDQYINWNQLTYDPQPLKPLAEGRVLMYYGAYREKREAMFKKYFQSAPYNVQVSTTTLRGKKFKALDDNITIIPPFDGLDNMPLCSASLYIEDPLSSKEFHSPANRFYELLSAGIPIFFEESTVPMLAEANIVVPQAWVVTGKEQLYSKLLHTDLDGMRKLQRDMWDKPYVVELQSRLHYIWNKLKETK
jgi:hypothetical protein